MSQFSTYRERKPKRPSAAANLCTKNHRDQYVNCGTGVVYEIPFGCGQRYIGETGKCVNDRLDQHRYRVSAAARDPAKSCGTLTHHSLRCCDPDFERVRIIRRGIEDAGDRRSVERKEIERYGELCVNKTDTLARLKSGSYGGRAAHAVDRGDSDDWFDVLSRDLNRLRL